MAGVIHNFGVFFASEYTVVLTGTEILDVQQFTRDYLFFDGGENVLAESYVGALHDIQRIQGYSSGNDENMFGYRKKIYLFAPTCLSLSSRSSVSRKVHAHLNSSFLLGSIQSSASCLGAYCLSQTEGLTDHDTNLFLVMHSELLDKSFLNVVVEKVYLNNGSVTIVIVEIVNEFVSAAVVGIEGVLGSESTAENRRLHGQVLRVESSVLHGETVKPAESSSPRRKSQLFDAGAKYWKELGSAQQRELLITMGKAIKEFNLAENASSTTPATTDSFRNASLGSVPQTQANIAPSTDPFSRFEEAANVIWSIISRDAEAFEKACDSAVALAKDAVGGEFEPTSFTAPHRSTVLDSNEWLDPQRENANANASASANANAGGLPRVSSASSAAVTVVGIAVDASVSASDDVAVATGTTLGSIPPGAVAASHTITTAAVKMMETHNSSNYDKNIVGFLPAENKENIVPPQRPTSKQMATSTGGTQQSDTSVVKCLKTVAECAESSKPSELPKFETKSLAQLLEQVIKHSSPATAPAATATAAAAAAATITTTAATALSVTAVTATAATATAATATPATVAAAATATATSAASATTTTTTTTDLELMQRNSTSSPPAELCEVVTACVRTAIARASTGAQPGSARPKVDYAFIYADFGPASHPGDSIKTDNDPNDVNESWTAAIRDLVHQQLRALQRGTTSAPLAEKKSKKTKTRKAVPDPAIDLRVSQDLQDLRDASSSGPLEAARAARAAHANDSANGRTDVSQHSSISSLISSISAYGSSSTHAIIELSSGNADDQHASVGSTGATSSVGTASGSSFGSASGTLPEPSPAVTESIVTGAEAIVKSLGAVTIGNFIAVLDKVGISTAGDASASATVTTAASDDSQEGGSGDIVGQVAGKAGSLNKTRSEDGHSYQGRVGIDSADEIGGGGGGVGGVGGAGVDASSRKSGAAGGSLVNSTRGSSGRQPFTTRIVGPEEMVKGARLLLAAQEDCSIRCYEGFPQNLGITLVPRKKQSEEGRKDEVPQTTVWLRREDPPTAPGLHPYRWSWKPVQQFLLKCQRESQTVNVYSMDGDSLEALHHLGDLHLHPVVPSAAVEAPLALHNSERTHSYWASSSKKATAMAATKIFDFDLILFQEDVTKRRDVVCTVAVGSAGDSLLSLHLEVEAGLLSVNLSSLCGPDSSAPPTPSELHTEAAYEQHSSTPLKMIPNDVAHISSMPSVSPRKVPDEMVRTFMLSPVPIHLRTKSDGQAPSAAHGVGNKKSERKNMGYFNFSSARISFTVFLLLLLCLLILVAHYQRLDGPEGDRLSYRLSDRIIERRVSDQLSGRSNDDTINYFVKIVGDKTRGNIIDTAVGKAGAKSTGSGDLNSVKAKAVEEVEEALGSGTTQSLENAAADFATLSAIGALGAAKTPSPLPPHPHSFSLTEPVEPESRCLFPLAYRQPLLNSGTQNPSHRAGDATEAGVDSDASAGVSGRRQLQPRLRQSHPATISDFTPDHIAVEDLSIEVGAGIGAEKSSHAKDKDEGLSGHSSCISENTHMAHSAESVDAEKIRGELCRTEGTSKSLPQSPPPSTHKISVPKREDLQKLFNEEIFNSDFWAHGGLL